MTADSYEQFRAYVGTATGIAELEELKSQIQVSKDRMVLGTQVAFRGTSPVVQRLVGHICRRADEWVAPDAGGSGSHTAMSGPDPAETMERMKNHLARMHMCNRFEAAQTASPAAPGSNM